MYLPVDSGVLIATLVIVVSLVFLKLRQTPWQTEQSQTEEVQATRPETGTLKEICSAPEEEFELIAVHGLAADPEWTWAQVVSPTDPNGHGKNVINKDKHLLYGLLKNKFPKARILSFADNSIHLGKESVLKTTAEIGKSLLTEVEAKRRRPRLPLVFMGHSMGGIIIKQALCTVGAEDMLQDTCGIIFLGTPHHGSSLSWLGSIVSFLTKPCGSDTTLVMSLTEGNAGLSNLAERFDNTLRKQLRKPLIFSFYETSATFVGWYNAGVIVSRNSSNVHAMETEPISTDHSGLNKCFDANPDVLRKLVRCIRKSRVPSRLEQVDNVLREQYHGDEPYEKLNIIRLSGKPLPMGRCFINLSIVEHYKSIGATNETTATHSSFAVSSRKAVDDVDKESLVDLSAIFDQRKRSGENFMPERILIRGRAGVGKTTLCKKIVHDFLHRGMWKSKFQRVLWIPLRNLKGRQGSGYNLTSLFYDEFFSQIPYGAGLADQLWEAVRHDPGKTLFILDGMDEVSQLLSSAGDTAKCLDNLLRQPNVIITSRPSVNLPSGITVDLELETIGFSEEQVAAYLKADAEYIPRVNEIQSFLRGNWLLRSLVRIPIQLDALCFIWEEVDPDKAPETMTGIYSEIVHKLWNKDLVRIGKGSLGDAQPTKTEIETEVQNETLLLEYLAFNGLRNDTIHFSEDDRDKAFNLMMKRNQAYKLGSRVDDLLAKVSFMRSSDRSHPRNKQTFHFIHLTYQEYFAARWFKRCWDRDQTLSLHQPDGSENKSVHDFVRQHKYTPRFNIMWRFVSGLCDMDTYEREPIKTLFDFFGKEPIDLIGVNHHRLLMHCLAEVVKSVDLRTNVETQLTRWLEFECNMMYEPKSLREPEFPAGALNAVFQNASDHRKQVIVNTFLHRYTTTPAVLELLPCWLRDPDASSELRLGMLKTVKYCGDSISTPLIDAVAGYIDNTISTDELLGYEASEVLGTLKVLPEPIQNHLVSQLRSENNMRRRQAVVALKGQSSVPQEILTWLGGSMESLNREGLAALQLWTALPQDFTRALSKLVGGEHSEDVREAALERLATEQYLPDDVLDEISTQLHDPDIGIRCQAFKCVANKSNLPNHDLQSIVVFLGEKYNFKFYSTWLYDGFDPRDSRSIDMLQRDIVEAAIARLGHGDETCRQEAVKALRNLSPFSNDTCRAISRQLDAQTTPDFGSEFGIFFHREDFPVSVAETLLQQVAGGDEAVMRMAKTILWDLGPLSAQQVDVVIQWLENPDKSISTMASCIVQQYSDDPDSFLRDMALGLKNGTEDAKTRMLHQLTALASNVSVPQDVMELVAAQLVPDDKPINDIILSTLDAFSDRNYLPEDIIIKIAEQLDRGTELKVKAIEVLHRQNRRLEEPILRKLLSQLDDENDRVKELALSLLSSQDNILPLDFLPVIQTQLYHPNRKIRRYALSALPPGCELPQSTLEVIELQLDDIWTETEALRALEGRPELPHQILNKVKDKLQRRRFGEVNWTAASVLISQKELCPEILLALAGTLRSGSTSTTKFVIDFLCSQSHLDDRIITALIEGVKYQTDSEISAMTILRKHRPRSPHLTTDMASLIGNPFWKINQDVIDILGADTSLPEDVVLKITRQIRNVHLEVRHATYNALMRQLVLPDTILKSELLYTLWLKTSFEYDVCCYVEEGVTYLNMPFNLGKLQLSGNPNDLKIAIQRLQNKFGLYL